MRVLLLNPPHKFKISRDSRWPEATKSDTFYYPFWLSYSAGILLENNHEALLIDAIAKELSFDEAIREIKEFKTELLVMETVTPTVLSDIRFLEKLKGEFPKIKTALVGTHVSALPEETLKLSNSIDFIARHEYEYTVLDLANTLEKKGDLKKVDGIYYKIGKKIIHNRNREFIKNLDELPFVSKIYKKFLDIKDYRYALAQHPMMQIWSSRGCPNRCTFCQIPQTLMSRTFRARSPENFVEELEWIKNNLPEIKEIFIEDDTFTTDKERVEKICDLIIKKKLKITWSANVRADLSYDLMKKMKEAGCRMIIVGYESGNQKILNNIKKGITTKMAKKFTKDAKRAGLKIFGCFMIGLPGDTKKTVEETFEYAKELNPDMAFFQQAVPFPGTELYAWVKENNYLVAKNWDDWLDENGQLNCIISYPWLTNKEIRQLRDRFTIRFYLSPKHLIEEFTKNLNFSEQVRLMKARTDYIKYLIRGKVKK
ncbi:MAG: magnesium-protoporphyrin IX monomethyl ester oxidative cyclase [Candidatus Aenigmarchaeota archaeon CG_4_10_14_0_8_um_filter_37_24]|nr:radical SAM protein [Candidatus Aenigmarchaeota archaeon]OIN88253.1 MAG: magnesium-protoporphyrin IX monomethyl ester oxidative cyclase [Candidatus Aenigmarchaeota archaeon CG1_02_38_14]PIV68249.1 MAG: magnesium-protoporphyrin IX monomethyl ester oxidative cyclase [Candidatus Aenigmarchaeota archaeon CG01_land_8_20_14_3_00_37_9]PIW40877.1 MAG: magnesium-protoporphyrin IX monomethyl ester oxidative cyclase [Candidatus Aenigmarchaeota archaeon CG15_BIG_FIL_POST_REV_8_21_14_020_37_27]PIX50226.1